MTAIVQGLGVLGDDTPGMSGASVSRRPVVLLLMTRRGAVGSHPLGAAVTLARALLRLGRGSPIETFSAGDGAGFSVEHDGR